MTRLETEMYKNAWSHEITYKCPGEDCYTVAGVSLAELCHYWIREFPNRRITLKNILVVYDELIQNSYYVQHYWR